MIPTKATKQSVAGGSGKTMTKNETREGVDRVTLAY